LFDKIKPEWPVGCKRLGASPGYLESIVQDNVDVLTGGIKRVVADGIIDNEGIQRDVDVIICATGFDTYVRNFFLETLEAAPLTIPLDLSSYTTVRYTAKMASP
jgi:cation diffusion facilitator CzcD-associated flavoprotein CzcO